MNGFTKVDNWLFDEVLPNVDAAAFKVIAIVLRKTAGWNKPADTISITQFQKLCGFSGRSMTQRAVDIAIESGYLIRVSKGKGFEYIVPESGTINESNRTQIRYDDVPESGTSIVPESGNTKDIERKYKTTISDDDFSSVYNLYLNEIDASISQLSSGLVGGAVDEYGPVAVKQAIEIAVRNGVRKWSYIDGVLKRQKAGGFSKNGNGPHVQQADDESGGFYA